MTADPPEPGSPKRRRAILVVSALAFGVLAATVFRLSQSGPVERLKASIGQDLRTLSEDEQIAFDGLLGQLAPEARVFPLPARPQTWDPGAWRDYLAARPRWRPPYLRSWYIWRAVDGRGRDRLVVFQGMRLWFIPGSSSGRTFVFDAKGKLLTHYTFHTGWRIDIEDARWLEDCGHGFPCLLVCSRRCINGLDIARQYYAFLDDAFALVRLEDSAGECAGPVTDIGPRGPARTPEQWETALRSSQQAEVLGALLWLGEYHPNPLRTDQDAAELSKEATCARETRVRPGVRTTVETLTRSSDRWVRDAAQHAWKAMQDDDR